MPRGKGRGKRVARPAKQNCHERLLSRNDENNGQSQKKRAVAQDDDA